MDTSKLKPFDLQAAKAGAKVVTRSGWDVTDIAHLPGAPESFRVAAVLHHSRDEVQFFHEDGTQFRFGSKNDLFMLPVQRESWVNLYADTSDSGISFAAHYPTQEKADQKCRPNRLGGKAHKITWDE